MNPQLKKGVLELCVLSQLTKEDKYGYELTDAISREMSIAAGTHQVPPDGRGDCRGRYLSFAGGTRWHRELRTGL